MFEFIKNLFGNSEPDITKDILSALRESRVDMAGVDIACKLQKQGIEFSTGSMYATLRKLRKAGLVRISSLYCKKMQGRAMHFSITSAGVSELLVLKARAIAKE